MFGNMSWPHGSPGWQPLHQHEPNPASPLAAFTHVPWLWSQFENDHSFNPTLKTISALTTVGTPRRRHGQAGTNNTGATFDIPPGLPAAAEQNKGGERRGKERRWPPPSRKVLARLEGGRGGQRAPPGSRLDPACPLPTPVHPRHEADGGSAHAAAMQQVGRHGRTEGYAACGVLLPPFLLLLLAGQRGRRGAGTGREAVGSRCERGRRFRSNVGAFPRRRLNWHTELEGVPRRVPAERSRAGCGVREPLSGCRESKPREDGTERRPH